MKRFKFAGLAIILLVMATTSIADEKKEKKQVKWQVNIEIQYNAVTQEEASKIIARVMEQNGEACKATAKTTLAGSYTFTSSSLVVSTCAN